MKSWQATLIRVGLSGFGAFVMFLPRRIERALAPILGHVLKLVLPKRRQVVHENLLHCFHEKSAGEIQTLESQVYDHLGLVVLELAHLFAPCSKHYRKYVLKNSRLEGLEHWNKAKSYGKGVLFVSSHLANWEFLVGAGSAAGIPLTMVTKHLKPQWLHKKIESARASLGVKAAYEPRTLPHILRALRAGEAVGFVLDQYAGPPIGIPVRFFGVEVGTLNAVGTLAKRTGAVILPVQTVRQSDGSVSILIQSPLTSEIETRSEEELTAYLATCVEHWIRENPAQWLWTHRRFKNVVWPAKLT